VIPLHALKAARTYQTIIEHIKGLHSLGSVIVIQADFEPVRLFRISFLALDGEIVVASYVKYEMALWTVECCDLEDSANHLGRYFRHSLGTDVLETIQGLNLGLRR
jgi:hypothetical protein